MAGLPGLPGFGLLLVGAVISAQTRSVPSYFKAGGTLVLGPARASEHLISIAWKHDEELLAEWVEDEISPTYYSRFRGRSELNTTTGMLKIHSTTAADTGLYSVTSNRNRSRVYQAVELQEVPRPVVALRPPMCSSASETCTLSCDGDVGGAGPVEYFWKKEDGEWEQSGKDVEILNDEEAQAVVAFSCRMKNPVSERDSECIRNPFRQDPGFSRDYGFWILTVVGAAVLALVAVAVCFLCLHMQETR